MTLSYPILSLHKNDESLVTLLHKTTYDYYLAVYFVEFHPRAVWSRGTLVKFFFSKTDDTLHFLSYMKIQASFLFAT